MKTCTICDKEVSAEKWIYKNNCCRACYMKQREEAKKMGLFKKKNIETKTFVNGQQQAQAEPIPGLKIPKPVVPNKTPPQVPEPETDVEIPEPLEPVHPKQQVKLVPGYYYWIDEYGDICFKSMRR